MVLKHRADRSSQIVVSSDEGPTSIRVQVHPGSLESSLMCNKSSRLVAGTRIRAK